VTGGVEGTHRRFAKAGDAADHIGLIAMGVEHRTGQGMEQCDKCSQSDLRYRLMFFREGSGGEAGIAHDLTQTRWNKRHQLGSERRGACLSMHQPLDDTFFTPEMGCATHGLKQMYNSHFSFEDVSRSSRCFPVRRRIWRNIEAKGLGVQGRMTWNERNG